MMESTEFRRYLRRQLGASGGGDGHQTLPRRPRIAKAEVCAERDDLPRPRTARVEVCAAERDDHRTQTPPTHRAWTDEASKAETPTLHRRTYVVVAWTDTHPHHSADRDHLHTNIATKTQNKLSYCVPDQMALHSQSHSSLAAPCIHVESV